MKYINELSSKPVIFSQFQGSGKKAPTRYDKQVRKFAERKKNSKMQKAVGISIEGRNMAL